MYRHPTDWISTVFGVLFSVIGVGLLMTNVNWIETNTAVLWAIPPIVLGVLLVASVIARVRQG